VKPRFQADNDLRSSIRTGVLRHEPSIDFQRVLIVPQGERLVRCETGEVSSSESGKMMTDPCNKVGREIEIRLLQTLQSLLEINQPVPVGFCEYA